ncbi:MAG: hypothetical protein DLM59_01135, partial [Pseudonocardiales bacterium]
MEVPEPICELWFFVVRALSGQAWPQTMAQDMFALAELWLPAGHGLEPTIADADTARGVVLAAWPSATGRAFHDATQAIVNGGTGDGGAVRTRTDMLDLASRMRQAGVDVESTKLQISYTVLASAALFAASFLLGGGPGAIIGNFIRQRMVNSVAAKVVEFMTGLGSQLAAGPARTAVHLAKETAAELFRENFEEGLFTNLLPQLHQMALGHQNSIDGNSLLSSVLGASIGVPLSSGTASLLQRVFSPKLVNHFFPSANLNSALDLVTGKPLGALRDGALNNSISSPVSSVVGQAIADGNLAEATPSNIVNAIAQNGFDAGLHGVARGGGVPLAGQVGHAVLPNGGVLGPGLDGPPPHIVPASLTTPAAAAPLVTPPAAPSVAPVANPSLGQGDLVTASPISAPVGG